MQTYHFHYINQQQLTGLVFKTRLKLIFENFRFWLGFAKHIHIWCHFMKGSIIVLFILFTYSLWLPIWRILL